MLPMMPIKMAFFPTSLSRLPLSELGEKALAVFPQSRENTGNPPPKKMDRKRASDRSHFS